MLETKIRDARLPSAFWVLFTGQLVNRIGNMVATTLVFFLRSTGLDVAGVGVVLVALSIGTLFSQPAAGLLADRFGPRRTLIGGMIATAGCMAGLGTVRGLVPLAVSAAALGLVGDLYRPASSVLVAELVPAAGRRQAFGLLHWAINLGYPVAAVTAGLLASRGYWLLFIIDALTCLAFAVIAAIGIPATVSSSRGKNPVPLGTIFGDFRLIWTVLLGTVAYAVYSQAWVGIPLAVAGHGLPPVSYGIVGAVNGIGIVILQPIASRLLRRQPGMRVLGWSWLAIGIGMGLTGFAGTTVQFALAAVIWTIGEAAAGGVPAALVAELAPAGAQGRYQAFYGWGWAMAKFLGAAVGTAVYAWSPALLWSGCALVSVLCCAAALWLGRAIRWAG